MIFVKKFLSKRNTQVIPQLNLIPAISNTIQESSPREIVNEQSQSIEMETFRTNSRIINVQPIQQSQISNGNEHENKNYGNANANENENENTTSDQLSNNPSLGTSTSTIEQNNPQRIQINNCKYNKNLINFTSVLMFVIILILFIILLVGTRYFSWMSADTTAFYMYVCFCFVSMGFPTLYFVNHPRHFINVLKELKFLS